MFKHYKSTIGYTINGTDMWGVTSSMDIYIGVRTTLYNIRQSTMIHDVASKKTVLRYGS